MKVITLIHKGNVQTITIEDLRKMKVELSQNWENLCKNCGKCCFDKSLNPNGVLYINYNSPCENLKFIGRKATCSVYEKRFDACEKCYTIPEAIQKRSLPADCPYVKSVVSYKAPVDNGNWYKRAKGDLLKTAESTEGGAPTGGTRDAYASPPPRRTARDEQLSRENLDKLKDWKRRRLERIQRKKGGQAGILDPREKTSYNIKPSGHQLGG